MADYEDGRYKDSEHRVPVYRHFKRILPSHNKARILTVGDPKECHDSRVVLEQELNPALLTIVNNDPAIVVAQSMGLIHKHTQVLYADLVEACEYLQDKGTKIYGGNLDLMYAINQKSLSLFRACGRTNIWSEQAVIAPNIVCAHDGPIANHLRTLCHRWEDANKTTLENPAEYKKKLRVLMAIEAFMYDRNDGYKVLEYRSYKRDDGACMPMGWCAIQLVPDGPGERNQLIRDVVTNVLNS